MTEFCKMPEEILSRLPPKSLMRFKCAHKSWSTVINNPKFIAKHLSNSMHNNSFTRILFKRSVLKNADTDEKQIVFSFLTFCNDDDDHKEHIVHYVGDDIRKDQFVELTIKDLGSVWIIGHCDGIICLADSSNVILWNPAIMEFKILSLEPHPDQVMNSIGFGCDPKSKEYKVVNIVCPGEEEYGGEHDCHLLFNPPMVQVYTLGSDSWREIKTGSLETETTNIWPEYFQMYFKGFCYWRGREQLKEFASFYDRNEEEYIRQLIVSFDTVDEVFHHILFPDSLYESFVCWYTMNLLVWNESIALFGVDHGLFSEYSWGLWVMDNIGGVGSSWIKQFTFGKAAGIERPLKFWKRDEILMVSDEGRLVSYNLDTEKLKYLPIPNMDSDHFEAVAYVDSMVPILGSSIC